MNSLVVYYSRTGTTKAIGSALAHKLKADIDEIQDGKARLGRLNYMRAARDAKDLKLTEIEISKDPTKYDLILIGTPIWWGHLPPAIRTYLCTYDLTGKKVAFFITSQGEDQDAVFTQMQELTPHSDHLGAFGILQKVVQTNSFEESVSVFVKHLN